MNHFDVIVLGTGGMGSSALLHLAKRGARACGLDRFPPGHDRGSSHGQTRLIRMAYWEHPDYVPLLRRSYAAWRDLEVATGRRLLVESGLLLAGPAAGEAVQGTLAAAAAHDLPIERMTGHEACQRWPAFRLPDEWTCLFEACGGYLFVEECVKAHADEATRLGAQIETGVTVRGWRASSRSDAGAGGPLVVETDRGRWSADRLVVTPGAWASDLLDLSSLRLHVLRKTLFWHEPRPDMRAAHAAGTMPCFAFDRPEGFFYGFPALDSRGVKIAEHTGGLPVSDPLAVGRDVDPAEQARVDAVVAGQFPRLAAQPSSHATCLYTMSPDGHFVVGLHPGNPRVAIAAGFSGHGFKFSSGMGEILADLAIDGRTDQPIGFLSPKRPALAAAVRS
jgi:sarcosine oxidase